MKHETKRWISACAAALLSVLILDGGLFLSVPVGGEILSPGGILRLLCLTVIFYFGLPGKDRRENTVSLTVGILMALMTLLGIRYSLNRMICRFPAAFFIAAAPLSGVFASGVRILLMAVRRLPERKREKGQLRREIGLWLFFMAISWAVCLPVFLAVYPGIYSYDASVQILQFFGDEPVSTHHPLIHTLYLTLCLKAGAFLFDSYQAGMAIHSLSQCFFVTAVFSFVLCRMRMRGTPRWLLALSFLYLVLNPYLTVFSFVTTKDVLFGAVFLLIFDLSYDVCCDPDGFFCRKRNPVFFFLLVLTACLLRNQGIYVYLFFAIFLFLSGRAGTQKKKREKRILAAGTLAVLVCWQLFTGVLPGALGIKKGDMREMLCVPMQQLARVWSEENGCLTEKQEKYIETLIDPAALEQYVRINADPVKSGFRTEVLKEDPAEFLSVWAQVGIANPEIYLDSFLMGNWGYWYPGDTEYWIDYIAYDGAFLQPEYNVLRIHRDTRFPALDHWLREVTMKPAFQEIPILSFILNQAFPFWLMLLAAAAAVLRREKGALLPLALIFGYFGTLLLGPVVSLRYVLPLMYCVPVMAEHLCYRHRPE